MTFKVTKEYPTYGNFFTKNGMWILKQEVPYPFPLHYRIAVQPKINLKDCYINWGEPSTSTKTQINYREFKLVTPAHPMYDYTDGQEIPMAEYEEV